jgi:iron complex outermembrane receptor protein
VKIQLSPPAASCFRFVIFASLGLVALATALPDVAAGQEAAALLPTVLVDDDRLADDRLADEESARILIEQRPGGVSLVDRESIEKSGARDLKDVLTGVPGLLLLRRHTGEQERLSIRGSGLRSNFGLRGVTVLIDGFPFTGADGFTETEALDLLNLRRVEVYRGGEARRWGGDTLGGAINMISRTGHDLAGNGSSGSEARLESGSWDTRKFHVSNGHANENTDSLLAVSHSSSGGFRRHSAWDRQRVYASLGRRLEQGRSLRGDFIYAHSNTDLPGALTPSCPAPPAPCTDSYSIDDRAAEQSYVDQGAARDLEYYRAAGRLDLPLSPSSTLSLFGQAAYEDMDQPLSFGVIDWQLDNLSAEARLLSLGDADSRLRRLDAGVQLSRAHQLRSLYRPNGGLRGDLRSRFVGEAINAAFYADQSVRLGQRVDLDLGARVQYSHRSREDRLSDDYDGTHYWSASPSLGLSWHPRENHHVYLSASHSYEPAVLLEITSTGNLESDLDTLRPQRAWQFEAGWRGQQGERLRWDLAVYDSELRNEIININTTPFPGAGFTIPGFTNVSASRHQGIELGLDLLLARGLARRRGRAGDDSLELSLTLNAVEFHYVDDPLFGDNEMPAVPPRFGGVALDYQHEDGCWARAGMEFVNDYSANGLGTQAVPGWELYSLAAGWQLHEQLEITLEVENLLDRRHVSTVVADSDDDHYIQPGQRRTLSAGLHYLW